MLRMGPLHLALFCIAGFMLVPHGLSELASGFQYYHSRLSPNSDDIPSEMDCTGESPLTKSAFLFIFNLVGFQTSCTLKIKPDQTSGDHLTYSAILKVALPAFVVYAGYAPMGATSFDRNAACMKGIKAVFEVISVTSDGVEERAEPLTAFNFQSVKGMYTGAQENCIGIYHLNTGSGEVMTVNRHALTSSSEGINWVAMEMLVRREQYFLTAMEYYEMMNCGSESNPVILPVDNNRRVTRSPDAVHAVNYPSGTECFYQVQPSEEHCDTVVAFKSAPQNCHEWLMIAYFQDPKTNQWKNETFDCGSETFEETHDNPPWIIHHAGPLIKFQFGAPGEMSTTRMGLRNDDYSLTASCLHTEASSHAPRCSSECSLSNGDAGRYENPCWGRSSQDCVSCRFARDEGQCVSQCPIDKFRNEKDVCQQCNENCMGDQSCFSSHLISCYKVCGKDKPDEVFLSNRLSDSRVFYGGYEALSSTITCGQTCTEADTVAFLNLSGTTLEHDDHYNQGLKYALENGVLDKMDFRCVSQCPEGYERGFCGTGIYAETEFCCPIGAKDQKILKILLVVTLVPALGSALLVLMIVFCIWGYKRHKKTELRKQQILKDYYIGEGKSNIRGIANKGQLNIVEPGQIELEKVIGQGAFGCVYSAMWCPSDEKNLKIPVAVKQLRNDVKLQNQSVELLEEAKLMASVNHENLVRLVAISMNEPMMLITKFMPGGASLQFIQSHKDIMTSYQFMEWARQLAAGMAHLESMGMIHRDLAARNVLVESPKQIRISDFGLSKLLDADKDEVDYRADDSKLPIRWLAKECLTGRLFSHKSDVWAYGVTLWEFFVYGFEKPYGKVDLQTVKDLVIRGRRLMQPATCSPDLYTQLLKCWMSVPDNRPSFTHLEAWFAESKVFAEKYFWTSMRNSPLGDSKKIQSNMVNLSSNSSNSNEQHKWDQVNTHSESSVAPTYFGVYSSSCETRKNSDRQGPDHAAPPSSNYVDMEGYSIDSRAEEGALEFSNKTTLEADVKPRERVAPARGGGGAGASRGWAEHQADTSVPMRGGGGGGAGDGGGSDSDQEYLVPQKPPGGAARQGSVSPSPVTPNVTFRKVDEDEYLRPVPMPRAANGNRISPPMHDTTSSVEADPRGGIQDFSIETREKQLKKFFPDMDVNQFDKAANIIDGTYDSAGGVEPESNYRGDKQNERNGNINDVEADKGSVDSNLDRKDKVRISQRWKGNKKPLQQQQRLPNNPDNNDYANQAGSPPKPSGATNPNPYARVNTADSMRRNLPAESSV